MIALLPEAQYHHAKMGCYLCTNPAKVIDTSVQIVGEGVLALCTRCVAEMATVAGIDVDTGEEVEELLRRLVEKDEHVTEVEKLNKRLRSEIRALKSQ